MSGLRLERTAATSLVPSRRMRAALREIAIIKQTHQANMLISDTTTNPADCIKLMNRKFYSCILGSFIGPSQSQNSLNALCLSTLSEKSNMLSERLNGLLSALVIAQAIVMNLVIMRLFK